MADCCGSGIKLIYSCSGAADVGEIADRVVRKLRAEGNFLMSCLAGVGAGLSGYVQSAKGADQNVTIDGCPVAYAKRTLEKTGVIPTSYILTDLGLVKGESPVTEKIVNEMCEKIKSSDGSNQLSKKVVNRGCACGGKC